MQSLRSLVIACALLALPCSALAAQETVWDFTNGNAPGEWRVTGLSPAPTLGRDGLRIRSSREGRIEHVFAPQHRVDLVTIEYTSMQDAELLFLFADGDKVYQIPVKVYATATPQEVQPPVTNYKAWDPRTEMVGIAVPAGLDLTLQRITVSSVNPVEKVGYVLQGLLKFDTAKPYIINFLWGPRLVFTPAELNDLFVTIPPKAPSVNVLLYGLIVIVIIVCVAMVRSRKWQVSRACTLCCITVATLWIAYDVRMGSEFMGYLQDDYNMYWSMPPEDRIFRVRGSFNAYAEMMAPILQQVPEYGFVAGDENYVDFLRYITYPSLPVRPEAMGTGITLLAVFNRPDALMDADGRLILGTGFQTPPGDVVAVYDLDSFLFRIRQ
jgi:hypothetical protein